jgi:hypothetical protein
MRVQAGLEWISLDDGDVHHVTWRDLTSAGLDRFAPPGQVLGGLLWIPRKSVRPRATDEGAGIYRFPDC